MSTAALSASSDRDLGVTPPLLRAAIDHPPARYWGPISVDPLRDRALRLVDPDSDTDTASLDRTSTARPDSRRVRRSLVIVPGGVRPDRSLPDVTEWSALLSVAIMQVLVGRRPLAQLSRWLTAAAVSEVGYVSAGRRRETARDQRSGETPRVLSVRVQGVTARVVEVAAHVCFDGVSSAIAFRLEAVGDRWSCSAIDLGPRSAPSAA